MGDLKFGDPLSSNPADVQRRGVYVAFGNTAPAFERTVEKDYAFSVAQGCDVRMYLFETFGGPRGSAGPPLRRSLAVSLSKIYCRT